MKEITYINLNKFIEDIYNKNNSERKEIIKDYFNKYSGFNYEGNLYKFKIDRLCDLLYNIVNNNEIIIKSIDVRYIISVSDFIKYLYSI